MQCFHKFALYSPWEMSDCKPILKTSSLATGLNVHGGEVFRQAGTSGIVKTLRRQDAARLPGANRSLAGPAKRASVAEPFRLQTKEGAHRAPPTGRPGRHPPTRHADATHPHGEGAPVDINDPLCWCLRGLLRSTRSVWPPPARFRDGFGDGDAV